jgi:hypothetical protein
MPANGLVHAARMLGLFVAMLSFQQQSVAQDLPRFREFADGILFSPVHSAGPPGAPYDVEIWEILVAKGRVANLGEKLPGAAVLELFSGSGSLRIGEKTRQVAPGAIVAVDERTPVTFDNSKGQVPLEFRATLVRRRTP